MEERHPLRFSPRHYFTEIIFGMCTSNVISFIERDLLAICSKRSYSLCTRVLEALIKYLRNKELCEHTTWFECKRGIQSFSVSGLSIGFSERDVRGVYRLVSTLTGILIVADNLAANYEERSSDEGSSRLFVLHWERELSSYLDKCLKTRVA